MNSYNEICNIIYTNLFKMCIRYGVRLKWTFSSVIHIKLHCFKLHQLVGDVFNVSNWKIHDGLSSGHNVQKLEMQFLTLNIHKNSKDSYL